jgi:hypothetical protein
LGKEGFALDYPVILGASYILAHAPNILMEAGTTQLLEKDNDKSEYYKKAPEHLRDFQSVVSYAPNQAYIGNINPDELKNIDRPWFKNPLQNGRRTGRFGEIFPEDEFYGLMSMVDSFDLVVLEQTFVEIVKDKLSKNPLFDEADVARVKNGAEKEAINGFLKHGAIELMYNGEIVGCVKRAHDKDPNLTAHTMLENLVSKASAVVALKYLIKNSGVSADEIDYIIECSEEACGDMNQRGGGNFAKAIGEIAGCINATGADIRGFCAAPAHAVLSASALVSSGIFKKVAVVAGGSVAKLGMNGRDHVQKGMPLLEDCLGGFSLLIGENDGKNPVIRTDSVGKHNIGTGSSPQAVIQSIVFDPLDRLSLKAVDIDKFAPELQNPDITEPAGAGDVPTANYKMIAALAVRRGELEKSDMGKFIVEHGMPGFAPTQGHIPSGVPFVGFAREMMLKNEIKRAMIVGKGSLFLGRMTNQFDGISFIIEQNQGIKGGAKEDVSQYLAQAFREFADFLNTRGEGDGS